MLCNLKKINNEIVLSEIKTAIADLDSDMLKKYAKLFMDY